MLNFEIPDPTKAQSKARETLAISNILSDAKTGFTNRNRSQNYSAS